MRGAIASMLVGCGRIGFDSMPAQQDTHDAALQVDSGDPLDAGLLLHFAFEADGLLYDRAPGHHAATCASCPTTTTGRVGAMAASFNGFECVTIPDTADLHPPVFTVALWLDVIDAQRATAFGKSQNGTTDTTNTLEIFYVPTSDWYFSVASQFTTIGPVTSTTWHHVAGVYDGSTMIMFLDGAPVGNAALATGVVYTNDAYRIGCDLNIGMVEEFLVGTVDDIRLYDRILAADEIAALAAM